MVNQVVHQNSSTVTVTDTTALDPNGIARPASITAFRGPTSLWNTGAYSYDGAGNIKRIGPSYFTYDRVSRLNLSSVNVNPGISTPLFKDQSYAFDAFGNIQSITTNGTTVNTPTNSATNRLDVPSAYDSAGDLTAWQGNTYEYDALNMMRRYRTAAGLEWAYIYNVDDERVWTYKTGGTESRWFLRGFDSKVLREYTASSAWQVANDYIYRDSQILASETPAGIRHYHLDHLGTPRLITDVAGIKKAFHAYYPFGQEATMVDQDTERMKFTGHERDLGNPASDADDLDYMHARFCSPVTGRFIAVDTLNIVVKQFGDEDEQRQFREHLSMPQAWNRYSYALGNPTKYVDPNGENAAVALPLTIFGSGGAAAANVGPQVVATAGFVAGYAIGTYIYKNNTGLNNGIQAGIGAIFDAILLAQNTKQQNKVVNSNIARAMEHLAVIAAAGGPDKDPDGKHHTAEIKTFLTNAKRVAERLPSKLRASALKKIADLAIKAGVEL